MKYRHFDRVDLARRAMRGPAGEGDGDDDDGDEIPASQLLPEATAAPTTTTTGGGGRKIVIHCAAMATAQVES